MNAQTGLRKLRILLLLFILGLVVAGITSIPLRFELSILNSFLGKGTTIGQTLPALGIWISRVHEALREMDNNYPFLAYRYDWLAFGHFVIAIVFIGPFRDPIRNRWVIDFGLIACALVIPYALLLGGMRSIPMFWRIIDGIFGILGFGLLWCIRSELKRLEHTQATIEDRSAYQQQRPTGL